ncbi:hypothetical protein [Bacillus salipaludis]|uniref:Citrate transporter-like domain-containing protein n=1 Tax=Bacillus salipaludis TaxID=2547811 RepID=A0ABW8RRM8_9BACI
MLQTKMMARSKEPVQAKSTLILSMCFAYIVHYLTNSNIFDLFLVVLCVVVFLLSIRVARPLPRYFSIGMFITGVVINVLKGTPIEGTANGILANMPVMSLVILVPLLTIPFKIDGYFDSIHFYMEKYSHRSRKIFGSISLFIFCLGPIFNIGTIRILHETIKDIKLAPVILAKSYLVGFSTVILWSPYFASVALVLYYLDVPILHYIPIGLPLAVFQFVCGNLLFWIWLKQNKLRDEVSRIDSFHEKGNVVLEACHRKKMIQLILLLICLIGLLFLFEFLTKWPMMFLVSSISIAYPVLWSLTTQKWTEIINHFNTFKKFSVPLMNNEIVLFMSAGLFGNALTGTAVSHGIKMFLNRTASISFLLFILMIVGIVLVFTFIGIHQIVVVTALVTQMDAGMIGTRPEVLALLLMMSWSMSAVISPVNPINLLVSGLLEKSGISVGLRWNGVFLLVMLIIGSAFVYLIH